MLRNRTSGESMIVGLVMVVVKGAVSLTGITGTIFEGDGEYVSNRFIWIHSLRSPHCEQATW